MGSTTKAVRVRKDAINRAVTFANNALKRDVPEGEALGIVADALSEGSLDLVIANMADVADSWAVAKVRERDEMWSKLLVAFACRETDAVWKISISDGRPWLHRESTVASTGEPLACMSVEGLVKELKACGGVSSTELN